MVSPSEIVKEAILSHYLQVSNERQQTRPFLVALCGIPGSGKSTVADKVKSLLSSYPRADILSMDGYHIPLSKLPVEKVYFRGACDTFDFDRFKSDLSRLRQGVKGNKSEVLSFPSFDHAKGDPEEGKVKITLGEGGADIVLVEGLYVLCEEVQDLFDFKIFIDSNLDKCIEGLKERNTVIPGYTQEEIIERCDKVDRVNAVFVENLRDNADSFVNGFNI